MRGQNGRREGEGFTLPELVVAIFVAAMLIGAASPFFVATIQSSRLSGAARQIVSDLRYAQSQAVAQGYLYRLHSGDDPLANQGGRYRLEQSSDGGGSWNGVSPWHALSSESEGIGVASITDSAGPPSPVYEVRFTSRGTCANPGAVTYPINIVISGRAGSRTIQVRQTGSVSVL